MSEKILKALTALDPAKDEHWTVDGQPRLDVLKAAAGDQSITRDDVVAAAPTFSRANPVAGVAAAVPAAPAAAPPVVTPAAPVAAVGNAPVAPAAPIKAPPSSSPKKGDPAAIAAATVKLAEANDKVAEIDHWIDKAQLERKGRVDAREAAQRELDAVQPIQSSQDAIRAYLNRQTDHLAARGAALAKAREFQIANGFPIEMLLPQKAKVDAVRRRPMGYGNTRPPVGK